MTIRFTVTGLRPIPADEIIAETLSRHPKMKMYQTFAKVIELEFDGEAELHVAALSLQQFMESCRAAGCQDVKCGPFEMV